MAKIIAKHYPSAPVPMDAMAEDMADYMGSINPNFDKDRFLGAIAKQAAELEEQEAETRAANWG